MLVIGGGMANTFLNAVGVKVGRSLCEHDLADTAKEILAKAKQAGCDVVLPTDAVVAKEFAAGAASETVSVKAVPEDKMILDVGPATAGHLARRLADCATLVWNGPLGAFEIEPFDAARSEEHTSELQSLMRTSYAVFCLKKKTKHQPSSTSIT